MRQSYGALPGEAGRHTVELLGAVAPEVALEVDSLGPLEGGIALDVVPRYK